MILRFSKEFTTEADLRTLSLKGLRVEHTVVDRHVNQYSDKTIAVYHVLNDWLKSQFDLKEAYINICQALRLVILKMSEPGS